MGFAMNSAERREARYQRRKARRRATKKRSLDSLAPEGRVATLDSLIRASRKCQRGVSWKRSVQRFCLNRVYNCAKLCKRLDSGDYVPGEARRFTVSERGKTRDISAVPFADRVVQRAICDSWMVPLVSRTLIYDNGASLPGKGTSFARDRLVKHLRRHYHEHGNKGYIVLFDFSRYFASIDTSRLPSMLERAIGDDKLISALMPFLTQEERGLGLGNQTSQTAAILYASSLDHWVKECWRVRGYGRYMDDGYALFATKEEARRFSHAFEERCEMLGLRLNPKKFRMQKVSAPFTFLKTRFWLRDTGRVTVRMAPESLKREKRRIRKHVILKARGVLDGQSMHQSYMSWRGSVLAASSGCYLARKMDAYYQVVSASSAMCL